jgi:hypothetical protein
MEAQKKESLIAEGLSTMLARKCAVR